MQPSVACGPHAPVGRRHTYTIGMRLSPATFAATFLLSAAGARADTVKLAGQPEFRNVAITGFHAPRLEFRGVSRQYLKKNLDRVEWLAIDGATALNAAEQAAAAGNWDTAVLEYERALSQADRPWLRDLVGWRFLAACGPAGRFDRAVELFAAFLESGTPPAPPSTAGPVGSDVNRRARAFLERALSDRPPPAAATPLRALLLELLLYEDVDPLPPPFESPRHAATDGKDAPPSAASASQPASRPDIATGASRRPVGILPAQNEPSAPAVPPPRLTPRGLVWKAATSALEAGDHARAGRLTARALPFVSESERGTWQVVLGRCHLESGRAADAVVVLMDVIAADADRALVADALYYVGMAHERLGRTDVAKRTFETLADRADAPDDVRARARAALDRLSRY